MSMETRAQSRLDAQDDRIHALTTQLESLHQNQERHYAQIQENQEKFQSMVMQCIRRMEKRPVHEDDKDNPETSAVLPKSPTPLPQTHVEGFPFHGHHQPFQHPYTSKMTNKLKLLIFSSTNPRGWLTRAETHFQIYETPEPYKIPLAHICMEGVAVHWFTIVRELNNNLSWEVFKTKLLNRFG